MPVLTSFGLLNSSREQGSSKGREVCSLAFNLQPSENHRFPFPLGRRGIEPQAAVCGVNAATATEVLHRLGQEISPGIFLMQNLTCSIKVILVTDSILSPAGVIPDKHWNHITEPLNGLGGKGCHRPSPSKLLYGQGCHPLDQVAQIQPGLECFQG